MTAAATLLDTMVERIADVMEASSSTADKLVEEWVLDAGIDETDVGVLSMAVEVSLLFDRGTL